MNINFSQQIHTNKIATLAVLKIIQWKVFARIR